MIETLDFKRQHAQLREEIQGALMSVLDSGQFILGGEVEQFEQDFAQYHGVGHGIGVNSGTDALKIALRALDVSPGDEVITTSNTFLATVGAIVEVGGTPRLVDVDAGENLDPDCLEAAISRKTKAIIVVHLRGLPANMAAIQEISESAMVPVVEDCSQATGAATSRGSVGSLGRIGCFSLHPQKNLGALGDAGIILTSDSRLAHRCRMLRNHGLRGRNTASSFGYNSRLDPLHAAALRVKLKHLSEWNERRRQIASHYRTAWSDLPVVLPAEREGDKGVYYHFVIRAENRNDLQKYLLKCGVRALVHYPKPIHMQAAFSSFPCPVLPRTERQAETILTIPGHCWLSDSEVTYVAGVVHSYFRNRKSRTALS